MKAHCRKEVRANADGVPGAKGAKLVLESHVFNPYISVFGFWCVSETFVVLLFALSLCFWRLGIRVLSEKLFCYRI